MAEAGERAALRQIAKLTPCRVVHVGYPGGTCISKANHARRNKDQYGEKFRRELMRGEHLCAACRIHSIASRALRRHQSSGSAQK